uniref:Uncharacterized protein n=1 Tax=Arundo donax TaxID=35708 RepID=A0A0A9DZU4_ARUDO
MIPSHFYTSGPLSSSRPKWNGSVPENFWNELVQHLREYSFTGTTPSPLLIQPNTVTTGMEPFHPTSFHQPNTP